MFTTGTVALAASSWSSSSGPVRTPIAATWRLSTRAVSRIDSPRVSWRSSERRTIGWPASSTIPASNETRVRVEGFWKMSATVRPSSTLELRGAALSSSALSASLAISAGSSSVPVRK